MYMCRIVLPARCMMPSSPGDVFSFSAGADVNDYLLGLGHQQGKTTSNGGLKILSLGQGQGPIAERLMETGRFVLVLLFVDHRG